MTNEPLENAIESGAEPLGYCPSCDYRLIAAGVCPECGSAVPKNQIRPQPRRTRVRKWIVRIAIVAITVGLIFAGRWAIKEGHHYRLYTNGMLIDTYPDKSDTRKEIKRRLIAARFDENEIATLVKRSFSCEVTIREPRPRNVPIAFNFDLTSRPGSLLKVYAFDPGILGNWLSCTIDDQTTKCSFIGSESSDFSPLRPSQNYSAQHETEAVLDPGRHHLQIALSFPAGANDLDIVKANPILTDRNFEIRSKVQFEVTDQPLEAMMECRESDQYADELLKGLKLVAFRKSNSKVRVSICGQSLSTDFHGNIRIISNHRGLMRRMILSPMQVTRTRSAWHNDLRRDIDVADNNSTISCELRADTHQAFNSGEDAAYAFVVRWNDIAVSDLPQATTSSYTPWSDCDQTFGRPPDSVVPLSKSPPWSPPRMSIPRGYFDERDPGESAYRHFPPEIRTPLNDD